MHSKPKYNEYICVETHLQFRHGVCNCSSSIFATDQPTNRVRKFNTKKDLKDVRAWERTICNAVKSRHTKHGWHLNSGRNNLPEGCAAAVLRINMFCNFPHFPPRSEKRDGNLSRTGVLFLRYYELFVF